MHQWSAGQMLALFMFHKCLRGKGASLAVPQQMDVQKETQEGTPAGVTHITILIT